MPQLNADQNLLFGILALQMDFISRDQLVEAMHAWVLDKSQTLGSILVAKASLSAERAQLMDALVREHLRQHQGNVASSLTALTSIDSSFRQDLEALSDTDVTASLKHVVPVSSRTPPDSPEPTKFVTMGFPSSVGQRFRILRPHAQGGLGLVSVAYDEELDREVALKEIQPEHAHCSDSRRRFVLEAEVTGGLEHPGIVPVYALGTGGDGRPFYAMRFIQGDSLKKAIQRFHAGKNGHAPWEADSELNPLLERFLDVCDTMAYAHSRGVLHRDLKPSNIMLGEFGETLVVDWGLAKRLGHSDEDLDRDFQSLIDRLNQSERTLPGSAIGTPQYMSPEQARGDLASLGPQTDVYSLGAILFEIITGKPPHAGKDTKECLMAAAQNVIVPTSRTGELMDIAYRAMSTRPDDRHQSVQELSEEVRIYLTHRESLLLTHIAERDLEQARQSGEYKDYAKARFRFEEAMRLWPQNGTAKAGLKAVEVACALEREDFDFAATFLDPDDPKDEKLRAEITQARRERDARLRLLKIAKRIGILLMTVLFLVVSGAAVWINNERQIAEDRRIEAEDAKDAALVAQKEAEGAKDAALVAKQKEEAAKLEEQKAKQAAIAQRDELARLNELAERRRREAEAQSVVASLNAIMAEEQQTVAEAAARAERAALEKEQIARQNEEQQRKVAVERRKEAEAQQIVASLNAIMAEEQKLLAEAAAVAERAALEKEQIALANEKRERERAEAERERAEAERSRAEAMQIVASLNAMLIDEQARALAALRK